MERAQSEQVIRGNVRAKRMVNGSMVSDDNDSDLTGIDWPVLRRVVSRRTHAPVLRGIFQTRRSPRCLHRSPKANDAYAGGCVGAPSSAIAWPLCDRLQVCCLLGRGKNPPHKLASQRVRCWDSMKNSSVIVRLLRNALAQFRRPQLAALASLKALNGWTDVTGGSDQVLGCLFH